MSAEQPLPGILEEQRGRWERKRCRTAKELLESEQRYLDRLGLVVTYFVAILKAKGTLRPPEQQTIFGRLEPLYSASRILITHLEKGHLTSGLEHLRHHLVLYLHYAENLEKAQKSLEVVFSSLSGVFVGTGILLVPHRTIRGLVRSATRSAGCVLDSCFQLLGTWDSPGFGITEERRVPGSHWAAFLLLDLQKQLRTNKSFGRFKKLQESRPELQGCRLEDLLALPLRRLRQYQHLLQDLLENTYPGSPDFHPLTGVLRSVAGVCHQVQEICRCWENAEQMHRVQRLLKGQKTQIQTPGRWFLCEGWLTLVPPKGEALQRRMLFLFSDILVMTKACHPLHPWNSHKFACQGIFPLQQCTVEKVLGHTQSQGGLLSLSFPHQTLLLMSCDPEELNRWHQCLLAAVRQLQMDFALARQTDNLPSTSSPEAQ
uniref:Rho guanine nucleotide exchange factor 39 n=1 Tax=Salvator merianae TaxID=96440 RepID=A0A8D0BZA8_SALMN